MLIAAVPAGANKPYAYRGNHFMRSGAATVVMPDETQLSLVLERAHGLARWELEASGRDLSVIDEREVRLFRDDAIKAGRARFDADASVVDVLRALNLLDGEGQPNRGAIALFGRIESLGGTFPTLGCRLANCTSDSPRPTSAYLMARIHGTRTCSPVSTVGALLNNSAQGHCEWCASAQMQGSVAPYSHPPVRRWRAACHGGGTGWDRMGLAWRSPGWKLPC